MLRFYSKYKAKLKFILKFLLFSTKTVYKQFYMDRHHLRKSASLASANNL